VTYNDEEYEYAPELEDGQLSRELLRLADLKRTIDILESERKELSDRVTKQMNSDGLLRCAVEAPDGNRMRVSLVQSVTHDVNLVRLQDMDPYLYEKVTKRVVDSAALKKAMNMGHFNEQTASTLSVKPRAAYVTFTPISEDVHDYAS
jgi:predicted phage-related endonuclease